MSDIEHLPLSPLDYHVLVVVVEQPLYGYAIKKAVEEESAGVLAPEIGSLYRVLARLLDQGFLTETAGPPDTTETHRGRPRRYYRITPRGAQALRADTERVMRVANRARAALLSSRIQS